METEHLILNLTTAVENQSGEFLYLEKASARQILNKIKHLEMALAELLRSLHEQSKIQGAR